MSDIRRPLFVYSIPKNTKSISETVTPGRDVRAIPRNTSFRMFLYFARDFNGSYCYICVRSTEMNLNMYFANNHADRNRKKIQSDR